MAGLGAAVSRERGIDADGLAQGGGQGVSVLGSACPTQPSSVHWMLLEALSSRRGHAGPLDKVCGEQAAQRVWMQDEMGPCFLGLEGT